MILPKYLGQLSTCVFRRQLSYFLQQHQQQREWFRFMKLSSLVNSTWVKKEKDHILIIIFLYFRISENCAELYIINVPWRKPWKSVWNLECYRKVLMSTWRPKRIEKLCKDFWKDDLKQTIVVLKSSREIYYHFKRQSHKMVKHTQTIRRQFSDELFECVWPFCEIGA